MLDKHLIIETKPIANKENIVFFANYRVTVLNSRLFRIENDIKKVFNNKATQTIFYRNAPKQSFTYMVNESSLTVKTEKATLVLDKNFSKSYALIGDKKIPLNNKDNLLGTFRTLDELDGTVNRKDGSVIELGFGVCSKSGVAVLDDTKSLILEDTGALGKAYKQEFDLYIFAYGDDYRGAVQGLYQICGNTPLIPRYALGNWWSRYSAYTDKEYLHILEKFEEWEIPLTVATIDMDWHYSYDIDEQKGITRSGKNTEFYLGKNSRWGYGWTGYSWNKKLFPDHKAFLKKIKQKNLKITLNLHPADGIRWFEDCYERMANAMDLDCKTEQHIPFDITDDNFINCYFSEVHKPLEAEGVDFWWIDWQQGAGSKVEGLDPLWSLNHYHTLDKAINGEPLILSRFCGVGSHRYPLGFSGDTVMSWESLNYLPYFTTTATNVGFTWWSHDIGGHFWGDKDDERFLRYVQYGVFNPINRLHCSCNPMSTKEPWTYMNGINELVAKWLKLRHSLIPYLYSANYQTHKNGVGLCEPVYYEAPKEADAYKYANEYIFGGQLLVAPITAKSEYKNLTSLKVWLPAGEWTDIFTGDIYSGGKEIEVVRWLDSIPVFARQGGIIPKSADKNGNCIDNPVNLDVDIYKGNGHFELYEDKDGNSAITMFTTTLNENKQIIQIYVEGEKSALPNRRNINLKIKNIPCGKVIVNGKDDGFEANDNDFLTVYLENFDYNQKYTIEVIFEDSTKLEYIKERTKYSLLRIEGGTEDRKNLYEMLVSAKSEDEFIKLVEEADIPQIYKKRLLEATFK